MDQVKELGALYIRSQLLRALRDKIKKYGIKCIHLNEGWIYTMTKITNNLADINSTGEIIVLVYHTSAYHFYCVYIVIDGVRNLRIPSVGRFSE